MTNSWPQTRIGDILELALSKDKKDIIEDVSEEELSSTTDGKVYNCDNYGKVDGDVNVGGVAGTMGIEYDYEIDAATGAILGFDYDIEWYMTGTGTVSQSSADIGAEKAKSIALKHAGVTASDTVFLYAKLDYENGLRVYDVEFFSGNKEYDYEINAATGDIVSFDQDIEWYAAGGYQAQANTDIGAEKAKSIALEHAGVAAADTVFINVELDYDDGMRVYDVEFFSGNKEYDYKIDAASGAILGFDFDVECHYST